MRLAVSMVRLKGEARILICACFLVEAEYELI